MTTKNLLPGCNLHIATTDIEELDDSKDVFNGIKKVLFDYPLYDSQVIFIKEPIYTLYDLFKIVVEGYEHIYDNLEFYGDVFHSYYNLYLEGAHIDGDTIILELGS